MKHTTRTFLAVLTICSGCAQNPVDTAPSRPQPTTIYTSQEMTKLTYCVGLTHNARIISTNKLNGRSAVDVKSDYTSNPNSKLLIPLVDKIYGDAFTNSWDYAGIFFNECALNVVNVPAERVGMANYCMQNGFIADTAQRYRDAGAPKEKAYDQFSKLPSETPRVIIDKVYSHSKGDTTEQMDAWTSCITPLVRK
jgi:hypothetical protein